MTGPSTKSEAFFMGNQLKRHQLYQKLISAGGAAIASIAPPRFFKTVSPLNIQNPLPPTAGWPPVLASAQRRS